MNKPEELWCDSRYETHYEIMGSILRSEFQKETVKRADLSYLNSPIRAWWTEFQNEVKLQSDNSKHLTSSLKDIIIRHIQPEHLDWIRSLGHLEKRIAAILFDHTFDLPEKDLAFLINEAFTWIAGIVDIKYPYEEHKELFPKNNLSLGTDWGKGTGIIRPHSDDIYEHRDINAMCLTVCKDSTYTPTWFWMLKDIVSSLNDEELGQFALSKATFYSGTNVEGRSLQSTKPILRKDPLEGLTLRLDFRVDDTVGARMRFQDHSIQVLFDKMRENLKKIRPTSSMPTTGSVALLSNFKVLHGRSGLNPTMLTDGESSRILFRSKGIRS